MTWDRTDHLMVLAGPRARPRLRWWVLGIVGVVGIVAWRAL